VFVPLVFAPFIALLDPVPVLVSVNLMLVPELVRSYPEAEKFNAWIESDALRLGCLVAAELKTATSLLPGTVPPQFAPVLKSVPVLLQVLLTAKSGAGKKRRSATAQTGSSRGCRVERRRASPRTQIIHLCQPLMCHSSSTLRNNSVDSKELGNDYGLMIGG
jgi:hypothetical protein